MTHDVMNKKQYEMFKEEIARYEHRKQGRDKPGYVLYRIESGRHIVKIAKARAQGDRATEAVERLRLEKCIKAFQSKN